VTEVRHQAAGGAADPNVRAGPAPLSGAETERIRRRVRLMVQIASRLGKYRPGLALATRRLTPSEAAILADLEQHGLDVPQIREVLCGAHVLVDDPDLYERWRFPKSRERLSSHHIKIDKKLYPDIGLKGPLVREKLHGRTAAGTWLQLEKTPASMGRGFHVPTWTDLQHLWDYIVYRYTKSNVGPWGLSKNTERRPMYLSPSLLATVSLPASAEAELTGALERIEEDDDVMSASPDLAVRFPPPERANTLAELVFTPGSRNGRGVFGSSEVYVTESPSATAREVLALADDPPRWTLAQAGRTRPATSRAGDREIRWAARRVPPEEQEERT
jgi:hypothetical protein